MAKKASFLPIIIAVGILGIILFLVVHSDKSPVAQFFQWLSQKIEGFASQSTDIPLCPSGYRFFNDEKGDSMCCNGRVDPITHTCQGKRPDSLCAFKPGLSDPRFSKKRQIGICSDIIRRRQGQAELEFCPPSLPHHAEIGKCCANPSDPVTGDCIPGDLQRQEGYCLTTAERKESDRGLPIVMNSNGKTSVGEHGGRIAEDLCINLRNAKNCDLLGPNMMRMPTVTDKDSIFYGACFSYSTLKGNLCMPAKELSRLTELDELVYGKETVKNPIKNADISKDMFNCDVLKKVVIDNDLSFKTEKVLQQKLFR